MCLYTEKDYGRDDELTVVLLAVVQLETNLHTVAGLAAQAAAANEVGVVGSCAAEASEQNV
jgi:hypothetical protein